MTPPPISPTHEQLAEALGFTILSVEHPGRGEVEYQLQLASHREGARQGEVQGSYPSQEAVWQFLLQEVARLRGGAAVRTPLAHAQADVDTQC